MIYDVKTAQKTASFLLQIKAIKLNPKNPFTWASGWKSPIYCDNRITLSYPEIRRFLSEQLGEQIKALYGKDIQIAGVATGAIGLGMLVAEQLDAPFLYVRPEPKKHGRQNQIEGALLPDKKIVVVEDLISTGKSSLNAVEALRKNNGEVLGMMALFTYGFDLARVQFEQAQLSLHTLSDYHTLLQTALATNYIDAQTAENLGLWRKNPAQWQPN
ncbi:MAG: orotate phosphoribosyltransferase [Flavobacteriia bacterium]|nr:orotate phosphoribosyltransferase [Flavobacteriia bacterium]